MSTLPLKIIHAPPALLLLPSAKRLRLSPFDRGASARRTPGQRAPVSCKQVSMDSIAAFPPRVSHPCSPSPLTVNLLLKLHHQLYPPKTRKSKVPDVPKELELYSDRGDSDMDEDTYSSSQEKHETKKVESVSVVI